MLLRKWCPNKKHFAELDLQHGGKTAGIAMIWRNYVTVTLCILAALLHGTPAAGLSQTLRRGTRNGIMELSQRAPSIFGWAAITLGIGSHSSLFFLPRLISAVADWMSTILPRMMWPYCEFRMHVWNVLHVARWKCRTPKSPKIRHLGTIAQLYQATCSQLRHVSTIGKSS